MLYVNPMAGPGAARLSALESEAQREEMAFQEVERLFAYMLMQEMRNTVPDDGLFPKTPAQRMYDEMMDDVLAGEWAESGQMGLAEKLAEQLQADAVRNQLRNNHASLP